MATYIVLLSTALAVCVASEAQSGKTKVPVKKAAASKANIKKAPVPKAKEAIVDNSPLMLKGFTPDFPDSLMVYLVSFQNRAWQGISGRISNKQFMLRGELPAAGMYNLVLSNPSSKEQPKYVDVFLDNEPTAIQFLGKNGNYKVLSGSSLMAFARLNEVFGDDFNQLSQLSQMKQSAGTFHYSMDSINHAWDKAVHQIETKVPSFLSEAHKTAVAPFLLCTIWPLTNYNIEQVETWMKKIDTAALDNDYGLAIKDYVAVEKLLGVGRPAPNFLQKDTEGHEVELSSFKGKYVLLDFWASWCGPCRMENPNVVSAFNKYKAKNFTVLGVSLDSDRNKWLEAIKADGLTWTQVSDLAKWQNAVARLYRVNSIPQNLLLDPEGKIIAKNLRGEALDAFLAERLK